MEKAFRDVLAFSRLINAHVGSTPAVPPYDVSILRESLIDEEYCELSLAFANDDIPAIADSIADLMYVLVGTAIAYGIDLPAVWDVVHAANMAKSGGPKRADGKAMKPDGWQPPDIAGILGRQKPIA